MLVFTDPNHLIAYSFVVSCVDLFFSDGQAIWMDENLRFGKTDRCQTFNNPPLCPSRDFEIKVMEVYGFGSV